MRVFSCLMLFVLFGCGPMNGKRPDPATGATCGNVLQEDRDNGRAVGLSNAQHFVVLIRKAVDGDAIPAGPADAGNHYYVVRYVHAADLTPTSPDTQMTAQYGHVNTATNAVQKKWPATVVRRDDGTFLVTAALRKGGTYEIDLTLSEGSVEDEHVVQVVI